MQASSDAVVQGRAAEGWAGSPDGLAVLLSGGETLGVGVMSSEEAFPSLLSLANCLFKNVVMMCARKPKGGTTAQSRTECTVFTPRIRPAGNSLIGCRAFLDTMQSTRERKILQNLECTVATYNVKQQHHRVVLRCDDDAIPEHTFCLCKLRHEHSAA